MNVQAVSGNIPAGLGDVTFEFADFGTPQLAIFQWGRAEVFNTPTANGRLGFGACTSDDQFATNNWCIDGGGNLIAQHYHTTSHCYVMHSTVLQATAYFKEWTANGVTITFDFNNIGAYPMKITCILVKGLRNVKLKTVQLGAQDVEVNVTGIGFEPTDIIGQCVDAAALDTIENNLFFLHGFAHNGDTLTQCSMNRYHPYSTYSYANMLIRSTRIADRITNGAHTWELEVANFDSDGFSLYARDGNTSGVYYSVIALQCPGDSWCGVIAGATSNGNKSYTGLGFQPIVGFLGCTAATAFDSQQSGFTAESVGVSVFTENNSYSHVATIRDNSTNAYSDGVSDELAWDAWVLAGAYQSSVEATFVSFDADGFTLNFTTNSSTQYAIAFLIGPATGPTVAPGETLEVVEDSLAYNMYKLKVGAVNDTAELIADSIAYLFAAALVGELSDVTEVLADELSYVLNPGFNPPIGDTLEVIEDSIQAGLINLNDPKRWLAPLRITPAANSNLSELYLAAHPIRHPTIYFEPKVKSYGTFTRSIPAPSDVMRSSSVTVQVIDADNSLRQAIAAKTIRKAIAELRLGPEDKSYAAFLRPWKRSVGLVQQTQDGMLSFEMRERAFEFMERNVPNVITSDNFPNLPENTSEDFGSIVVGVVESDQGALPCPLVDTVNFRYLVCRNRARSVTGVYRKADDSDEFELVSGSEYTIRKDYYIEHELGTGDYCTLIEFNSDQGGKEIRANAEGVTVTQDGLGDLAYTNFADCLEGMLAYLVWALDDNDILNAQSIAAVKDKVTHLTCGGALTKQMTFRQALGQIQRSCNIDVFTDKNGRIAFAYTGDDDEPVMDLSDTVQLYGGSMKQSLAEPVYNKIIYNYNPNYAAGSWDQKTYRNEEDYGILDEEVEAEPIQLYFVRDATTALNVIQRRMQYQDLNSFRFEARIPLVPVVEELELGDLVTITHFGGIKAGGYVAEQFKVLELGMSIDNLEYVIKGIRRRLPPPALLETDTNNNGQGGYDNTGTYDDDGILQTARLGISARSATNARHGPFSNSVDGELFAVFKHATVNRLAVWYTQNWGKTWVERDVDNAPSLTNSIVSFDVCALSGVLHIAVGESGTGRVSYHTYNMVTKAWATLDQQIVSGVSSTENQCVSIDCRYPDGEPVIFYQSDAEVVGGRYWRRGSYSILQNGTWSTPVVVTPTPRAYLTNASSNCDIQRVIPGRENRMHFMYEIDPAERWVSWSPDDWGVTMDGSLALETAKLYGMSSIHYPAPRNINSFAYFNDRENIAVAKRIGWSNAHIEIYTEHPLTKTLDKSISGTLLGSGGGGYTHNPAVVIGSANDVLYALTSAWSNKKVMERTSEDDGVTWSANVAAGPALPSRYVMEFLAGQVITQQGKQYIAYFSNEGSFPIFRWILIDGLPYS